MAAVGMLHFVANATAKKMGSRNSSVSQLLKIVTCSGSRFISSKSKNASIDLPQKLAPYPYKTKKLGQFRNLFERTLDRLDENSKVLVVEGNIAAGKTTLAQELAKQLDMLYIPEATMDMQYINKYGHDIRDYKDEIPESVRPFDITDFYGNPNHMNAFTFQANMYQIRYEQYIGALAHILNTGQGVVLDRCVYSDFCFLETMVKFGYVSGPAKEYYYLVKANTIGELMKPHLVIYLDVPVNIIQERIKKRGRKDELSTKVLTPEYLQSLEEVYKFQYLKEIGKHAELLIYDWSTYGDVEVVVEDIERVKFYQEDNYDPKLKDWRLPSEKHWKERRHFYTNQKEFIMGYFRIPAFDVPEFLGESPDWDKYWEVFEKIPGNKYAEGFNSDMGDKNILFKH